MGASNLLERSTRAPDIAPAHVVHLEDQSLVIAGSRPARVHRVDPGIAGGLRAWLEDVSFDTASMRRPPSVIRPPRRFLDEHDDLIAPALAALFALVCHGVRVEDPIAAVREAIALNPQSELAGAFVRLAPGSLVTLRGTLAAMLERLDACFSGLSRSASVRTSTPASVSLNGGGVILHARFDALLAPLGSSGVAVSIVDLSNDSTPERLGSRSGFLALVETLRSTIAPDEVVSFDPSTGTTHHVAVTEEILIDAVVEVTAMLEDSSVDGARR